MAILAFTESPLLDAGQSVVDFYQDAIFIFYECHGDLFVEVFGTKIRQMNWYIGQVSGGFSSHGAKGFFFQVRQIADDAASLITAMTVGTRSSPLWSSLPPHFNRRVDASWLSWGGIAQPADRCLGEAK